MLNVIMLSVTYNTIRLSVVRSNDVLLSVMELFLFALASVMKKKVLTPEFNVRKCFFFIIDDKAKKARVEVLGNLFQPGLIFASKSGAYPRDPLLGRLERVTKGQTV
jgi:hypothetical protein